MKNGSGLLQRAQARVAAAGGHHIGDLIAWNTDRINVSRLEARRLFASEGLGNLIPDLDPATALSRAAGEVRRPEGIVVRPFAGVECAFLDEVFKGSDSVLNTLLSAMNERIYKGKPIPLRMLVGASNELPEEEILAAVYDRFLLRDVVEYVQADATWTQLMTLPPIYTPTAQITVQEWDAARAFSDRQEAPKIDSSRGRAASAPISSRNGRSKVEEQDRSVCAGSAI